MTRTATTWIVFCALIAAASVLWTAQRMKHSQADLHASLRQVARVTECMSEIQVLETQASCIGLDARPTEDVQTPIIYVLEDLALESSLFRGIEETENRALEETGTFAAREGNGPTYRRQSMLVQFKPAALRELGAILAGWRIREPAWIPSRLVLSTSPSSSRRQPVGLYALDMTLTSIYLDEGGGTK